MIAIDSPWPDLVASREAWAAWLALARVAAPDAVAVWSDTSECAGCVHRDRDIAWCRLADLPASYNPILTPRHGLVGMACCGAGFETNPGDDDGPQEDGTPRPDPE